MTYEEAKAEYARLMKSVEYLNKVKSDMLFTNYAKDNNQDTYWDDIAMVNARLRDRVGQLDEVVRTIKEYERPSNWAEKGVWLAYGKHVYINTITGKYHFVDETENFDREEFDTAEDAYDALTHYANTLGGNNSTPKVARLPFRFGPWVM